MPIATLPKINKLLEATDLERLCALPGPCITVLLPAYRPGSASTSEAVPLKSLLRSAPELPAIMKVGPDAEALLEPIRELANSPELALGGAGLALFSAPGFTAGYRNRGQAGPKLAAGRHPFVRPLLGDAFAPAEIFALVLSRKHPRLFRYRHQTAEEVELPPGVPKSLAEAGEFDQPDHNLANRSASGASTGSKFAVRFGTLSDRESAPEYLHHYFALIDRGLHPVVKDTPVLLMGVAEEIAAFRKAAGQLQVMQSQFTGSADSWTVEKAAQKAREAALASYRSGGENVLQEFREMTDRNRACTGLSQVLAAAEQGRVHRLLLANEAEIPAKDRKDLLEGEDVLNAIAVQTIRTSGQIFTLPGEIMGDAAPAAALLRY